MDGCDECDEASEASGARLSREEAARGEGRGQLELDVGAQGDEDVQEKGDEADAERAERIARTQSARRVFGGRRSMSSSGGGVGGFS